MSPEILNAVFLLGGAFVGWIAQRRGWKLPPLAPPAPPSAPAPAPAPAPPGPAPLPTPLPLVPVDQFARALAEQLAVRLQKVLEEALARLVKELSDTLGGK